MPLYKFSDLEAYSGYVSDDAERKQLVDALQSYRKKFAAEKNLEIELEEEVYLALKNVKDQNARSKAAQKIINIISSFLSNATPAKAAGFHLDSRARSTSTSSGGEKDTRDTRDSRDRKHSMDTKDSKDRRDKDFKQKKDSRKSVSSVFEEVGDEETPPLHHGYDKHRRTSESVSSESDTKYSSPSIAYKVYLKSTEDLHKSIQANPTKGLSAVMDDQGVLKVYRSTQGKNEDVFSRSYDEKNHCAKVTLKNPPSDENIKMMLDMNRDLLPLQMTSPCKNENTCIRLLEASIISGKQLELHDQDIAMLERSKEYGARYRYLTGLEQEGSEAHLSAFRKFATDKTDWKFGESGIDDKLIKAASITKPVGLPPAEEEEPGQASGSKKNKRQ